MCSGWNNSNSWSIWLWKNCNFSVSIEVLQFGCDCVCWLWWTRQWNVWSTPRLPWGVLSCRALHVCRRLLQNEASYITNMCTVQEKYIGRKRQEILYFICEVFSSKHVWPLIYMDSSALCSQRMASIIHDWFIFYTYKSRPQIPHIQESVQMSPDSLLHVGVWEWDYVYNDLTCNFLIFVLCVLLKPSHSCIVVATWLCERLSPTDKRNFLEVFVLFKTLVINSVTTNCDCVVIQVCIYNSVAQGGNWRCWRVHHEADNSCC